MLIIASIIILIIIISISIRLSNRVIKPIKRDVEYELNKDKKTKEYYSKLSKISISFKFNHKNFEKDEVIIDSELIFREGLNNQDEIKENQEKLVILAHGFKSSRVNVIKYINIFREKGYNVLVYDQRNSGYSSGIYTTMGFMEKYDLKEIIKECKRIFGEKAQIGILGESMGASTALLMLEIEDNIDFIIADCGYSVLVKELAHQLKTQHKLPSIPFIIIANIVTKIRSDFSYYKIRPIDTIGKHGLNVPILFIHGELDDFTPTYMANDMYEKRKNVVESSVVTKVYIAPNSSHAKSCIEDKEEYKNQVYKFLDEIS